MCSMEPTMMMLQQQHHRVHPGLHHHHHQAQMYMLEKMASCSQQQQQQGVKRPREDEEEADLYVAGWKRRKGKKPAMPSSGRFLLPSSPVRCGCAFSFYYRGWVA